MQHAGSEKTLKKANTDGGKVSIDLPNILESSKEVVKAGGDIVQHLKTLGFDRQIARRILLANGLTQKQLDRKLVAGIASGEIFNTVDRLARQHKFLTAITCGKRRRDKDGKRVNDDYTRVAAAQASAQIAATMSRLIENLVDKTSEQGAQVADGDRQPGVSPVAVNMQFNMPPVGKPATDANTGADT